MSVAVNGQKITYNLFPNGETAINRFGVVGKIGMTVPIIVSLKYTGDVDITLLMMVKKHLDEMFPTTPKYLEMLYVPYSRMDREIKGYLFTLKYFCQIINSLNFDKVRVMDTHSSVTTALLERVIEEIPRVDIIDLIYREKIDFVLYPDLGAMKRYAEMFKLPNGVSYFCANKKRNLQTGEIIKFELVDCPDIKGKNILIIDDLCSRGGTFLASAKLLKESGASDIFLYVSHCENSIFDGDLLATDWIKTIYTTDSIVRDKHRKIKIIGGNK